MAKRKKHSRRKPRTARKRRGHPWTAKGRIKRRIRKTGRAAGKALSKW